MRKTGRPFQLVATKTDRLSGNKLKQSLASLSREFGTELLPYSVKTGAGKDELWKKIRTAIS
jgi:GTP-binding protein EngB required for normal cell division